jgi:hypothetical protein
VFKGSRSRSGSKEYEYEFDYDQVRFGGNYRERIYVVDERLRDSIMVAKRIRNRMGG